LSEKQVGKRALRKKRVSWQEEFRAGEAAVNVAVIDTADSRARCSLCDGQRLIFYVHCFREENRPIVALCKDCTSARAGGAAKVYVKEAPGPWLRKRWAADKALPKRSVRDASLEALRKSR
jgi:hypothetical protein